MREDVTGFETLHSSPHFDLDSFLSFLREAAQHAEQVEAILLSDYRISQVQIDGLWTYVGRKETKKTP